MTDDELFGALASATFVPLVDDAELDRRARHTARRIRRESRRELAGSIRRWWVALVTGVVLLVAGVGAATGGLLRREPVQQDLVWCYTRVPDDLTDDTARAGHLFLASDEPRSAQRALDLCYSNADSTRDTVPIPIPDPVSICVLTNGDTAVLPIGKCADIGLPESSLEQVSDD